MASRRLIAVLAVVLGVQPFVPTAPTNLSVSLRAVSWSAFKVQFSWRAPDTLATYRYVWKAMQGTSVRLDTTTAKSVTIRFTRTHTSSSYTLCTATLISTGFQSPDACRTLAVPQVDTTTLVELRQTGYGSSTPPKITVPVGDTLKYCAFAWIRGKVIRDPVVNWTSEGIVLIPGTSDGYKLICLPRVPTSLLWPMP